MRSGAKRRVSGFLVFLLGIVLVTMTMETGEAEQKPYSVQDDGTVDWYTYSGFRRYHAECHTCHGPDGLGSTFAPDLVEAMTEIPYDEYVDIVVHGRVYKTSTATSNMPGFGQNKNVMCFVDDIYAYLMARADGALGRGRPENEPKPMVARERDSKCFTG